MASSKEMHAGAAAAAAQLTVCSGRLPYLQSPLSYNAHCHAAAAAVDDDDDDDGV